MKNILVNDKGSVRFIEMNRPDFRNAFHPEMIAELTTVFKAVKEDTTIRAVVLSGAGKSFSAGADLTYMKSMAQFSEEQNIQDSRQLFAMFSEAFSCPVPVFGRVHGHVMGGAMGLISICDVVVAEASTQFAFSEVKLGLVPAVISPFVLSKASLSLASQWMLTGQIFTVTEAQQMGLVHYVGAENKIEEHLQKCIDSVLAAGPEAMKETKRLIRKVWQQSLAVTSPIAEEAIKVIAHRRVSAEGQEGLQSFFQNESQLGVKV